VSAITLLAIHSQHQGVVPARPLRMLLLKLIVPVATLPISTIAITANWDPLSPTIILQQVHAIQVMLNRKIPSPIKRCHVPAPFQVAILSTEIHACCAPA